MDAGDFPGETVEGEDAFFSQGEFGYDSLMTLAVEVTVVLVLVDSAVEFNDQCTSELFNRVL